MPRDRKRKTNIGQHTEEEMRAALVKVSEGQKLRAVARTMNILYTTLYRYNEKIKNSSSHDPIATEKLTPNYSVRKIFTEVQEKDMFNYIKRCSNMFYGLTLFETRKLAYEMAISNNIPVPDKWHETQAAGLEWLYGFRKRCPNLSLRTPEGCSLSRATSFNRHNVKLFYDNLDNVMSRQNAFGDGTRVYNLDETDTMTVQKSAKVLAVKGQKQVSKVTSAERGTLVTTCYIVNALGNTLPPVMIFPRVHFKSHMINEAPAGTLGLATQNGWMNGELFVQTMQHFISHTNSSKDNPSLLIFDNHESHICIQALYLAKDNGVTVLTVPPHSTGKLQPLDVGVFGPFKLAYNKAVDSWMMRNPGKTLSIYEVAGCVKEAHMKAMTPNNICNAFKATGIFPFNRDIFTDDDFAPSEVTDRPLENELPENRTEEHSDLLAKLPQHNSENIVLSSVEDVLEVSMSSGSKDPPMKRPYPSIEPPRLSGLAFEVVNQYSQKSVEISRQQTPKKSALKSVDCTPSTSRTKPLKRPNLKSVDSALITARPKVGTPTQFNSPFQFRGLPQAGPRKRGRTERRKGKSMIATDTPNKNEIEKRAEEKNSHKRKKTAKAVKKKILESDSEEEEDRISLYSEEKPMMEEDDEIIHVDPTHFRSLQGRPKEGNFILVEFKPKEKKVYYIAKVIGDKNDIEVSFLRKSVKNPNKFHVPT